MLITVLMLVLLVALVFWLIESIPMPIRVRTVLRIVVLVVAILYVLRLMGLVTWR